MSSAVVGRASRSAANRKQAVASLKLGLGKTADRLNRLTDAWLDREIDRDDHARRKEALLKEQKLAEERIRDLEDGKPRATLDDYLELAEHASLLYKLADPELRRMVVGTFTSNRTVSGRKLEVMLAAPFREVAERRIPDVGGPSRGTTRNMDMILSYLNAFVAANRSSDEEIDRMKELLTFLKKHTSVEASETRAA